MRPGQSGQLGRRQRHGIRVTSRVTEAQDFLGHVGVAATGAAVGSLGVNFDEAGDDGCVDRLPIAVIGIIARRHRSAGGARGRQRQ